MAAIVWGYAGLPPDQMSGRVMPNFQRALTTNVNDIEHTSFTGIDIVTIFFQSGATISSANAQVTAIEQTAPPLGRVAQALPLAGAAPHVA